MPAEFLTPEQAGRYGRYNGDPAPAQLAKYFFLDDNDRAEIASHRGTHNRLGYAIQLCTVRFLGTFLPEPTDVPSIVVKHLAEQLEIQDANCLGQYRERLATHHTHVREIRERHVGAFDRQNQGPHRRTAMEDPGASSAPGAAAAIAVLAVRSRIDCHFCSGSIAKTAGLHQRSRHGGRLAAS